MYVVSAYLYLCGINCQDWITFYVKRPEMACGLRVGAMIAIRSVLGTTARIFDRVNYSRIIIFQSPYTRCADFAALL
jgi:hypothetical protein